MFLISVTISVVTGENTPVPVERSVHAPSIAPQGDQEAPVNLLA